MEPNPALGMTATKEGEDSSIQRMIKLVKSTDPGTRKLLASLTVGLRRFRDCVIGTVGTCVVTGEIIRAVTILVVFCPSALVLATPAAIMAAISNASQHGFLKSAGNIMERLAKVDNGMTFDKTGTFDSWYALR